MIRRETELIFDLLAKAPAVKIPVRHPGILEVPVGKHVWNLRKKDLERLIKKKGYAKVSRAINNLYVWNKKKKPKPLWDWVQKAKKWLEDFKGKYGSKAKTNASILAEAIVERFVSF